MRIYIKLILFLSFGFCHKFSFSQQKGNIKFAIGSSYNYRNFNKPRYKKNIDRNQVEMEIVNARMDKYKKYEAILDSIDVPVIAPAIGLYFDNKIDSIGNNGFIFRTGLQLGIKDYPCRR